MTISFNEIPNSLRVPFVAAEFNSSAAAQGPAVMAYRALLIGQRRSTGTATANTLHRVTNADQVRTLAGQGSILHRQAIAWFKKNKQTELWIGVVDDDAAGVAATGSITITASSAKAGTIALWLGGNRITVGVAANATANTIATAMAAAINAAADLPVTASAATNVVTLTHRHKGLTGNSFDVRHSYRDDEALPSGVTMVIVGMAGGTTAPALDNLIAAMGDTWFHIWSHPYTDATSLAAIEAELSSRFGAMRMIDGLAITSASGTLSALTTLGGGRNSQHSVIVAQAGEKPLTPPGEFAAEVAAVVAIAAAADPARPFQTLALSHAKPPKDVDQFTAEERNQLLFDGIATTRVGAGDVVQLDRLITTYQTNAAGAEDTAYLDATTLLTLMYMRFSWRVRIATRYPRHKLANDGGRIPAGQAVITPKVGKAEAIGWFRDLEDLGLVENAEQFKADLVCVRNASDPNRLDWLLPPDLINQLIGAAASLQFRL